MRRVWIFVLSCCFGLSLALSAWSFQDSGNAYYDFGVFAYEDGDYEDALTYLHKALQLHPDDSYAYHALGKTFLKMQRFQEASESLNQAMRLNPDMVGLAYDMAMLSYKQNDFEKAFKLFDQVASEEPEHILAQYYSGICLFSMRSYRQAIDRFEAAAQKSPSIRHNSHYYAGICYLKTDQVDLAIDRLQSVFDHSDSKPLRDNALLWLSAAKKRKTALRPYSLYARFGIQYDDNVVLEPLDEDIYSDESDYVAEAFISGRYKFVNSDGLTLGVGYSHYQNRHEDLSAYDLIGSIFSLYGQYRLETVTLGLYYTPSYYWLDSESYLLRHEIRPELIWAVSDDLTSRLSLRLFQDTYFENPGKDGNSYEMNVSLFQSLFSRKALISAEAGYEDNYPDDDDEDYGQLKLRLSLTAELAWGISVDLTGKYFDKQYERVDSIRGLKREDSKYVGLITVSHSVLYDWLALSGSWQYTKNDSNMADYCYKRNTMTVSLSAAF